MTDRLAGPRERMFAAWTDPAQLARWWGPSGFTNTFQTFDLRPGGDWRFAMHGPDGTDYQNHSVFDDLRPNELLAFTHQGPMRLPGQDHLLCLCRGNAGALPDALRRS